MDLKDMSWKDVEEYLKKRRDILLPFGSVEEHGYHLPLSTDGDIAIAISKRIAEKTGIAVAPIVWYGVSNTTKGYIGTTAVCFNALKKYSKEIMKGLKESGFQVVYILSGHLSNSHISAIKEAAREIPDLKAYLLDISKIPMSDILETEPMHACEAETSLMLYLHPEKVDLSKAIDEEVKKEKFSINLKKTKSGVFGAPTKATREKGRLLFNRIVLEFTKVIE
jgi:creatinine amidohydrolase